MTHDVVVVSVSHSRYISNEPSHTYVNASARKVFAIPELVQHLASYLGKKELSSCIRVCSAFALQFAPLIWQNIKLKEVDLAPLFLSKVQRQLVYRNLHLILRLKSSARDIKRLVELLATENDDDAEAPCPSNDWHALCNLREIDLNINQAEGALEAFLLIERNTNLKKWIVRSDTPLSVEIAQRFLDVLQGSKYLVSLEWRGKLDLYLYLRAVLQHLPKHLKVVRIYHRDTGTIELAQMWEWDMIKAWPEHSCLREISLSVDMRGQEDVFFKLLEGNRPDTLERVIIPRMQEDGIQPFFELLADFRKLTTIDLGVQEGTIDTKSANAVLGLQHVKSFSADVYIVHSMEFVRKLISQWESTLRSLRLGRKLGVDLASIQLIMVKCSRLKVLDILTELQGCDKVPWSSGWDRLVPEIHMGVVANGKHTSVDWGCLKLERFNLIFINQEMVDGEVLTQLRKSKQLTIAAGIKRAYQQLGRLHQLRELNIGWVVGRISPISTYMDLSLESGLHCLKGLSELRRIYLGYMQQIGIGREELDWVGVHWQKLEQVRDLSKRPSLRSIMDRQHFAGPIFDWERSVEEEGSDGEEDEADGTESHVAASGELIRIDQWLRSQRPDLWVS
ncbi:hypothetical protein BGZ99_005270 [Dissophora globulifera]|uniref:F-box domain-containing protein n=1 Tax=Dissophora globulifera TaxID=979702 RepID=A0A9P6UTZ6_9FUNG|nr:hypothetical protein BGZ99_005270 [Dissophora globulifera]